MRSITTLCLLAAASAVLADELVVANQYAATPYSPASGLNTFIRDLGNARTGQLLLGSAQLSGLAVGDTITGMTYRLYNGATTSTWTGHSYTDYQIRIGAGVAPAAGTTTFANNFTGTPTLVRSGALTMSGYSSVNTGATPNPWGDVMTFSTGFVYAGGDLVIEVRHDGATAAFPNSTFAESVSTAGLGYGTEYRSFTAAGKAATVGAQATFTMAKLTFDPVPEPASMIALGLGVAALAARRRRKKAA